jgi:hypothetical protein
MLLFYQVATRLSLTTCWQVVGTTCNESVELNNLIASYQQTVHNLLTSWEQAVRTHPVDKLLEQHCYKSAAAGLLQLVRSHVCSWQVARFWRLYSKTLCGLFLFNSAEEAARYIEMYKIYENKPPEALQGQTSTDYLSKVCIRETI